MRIVAILAAFNEERFIGACLEHLIQQGVQAYLIDNCSTDRTVTIAERYVKRGVVGIESFPRGEMFSWGPILERKVQVAASLDADWFAHVDPDEIRLPPHSRNTLAEALAQVDSQGYNAVNFFEFTFVPTLESPDHDHPDFQKTMRWYYPFLPFFPHRLNAWKRQSARVELAWSGGHQVRFPGLRMYPEPFWMRHYLFLSVPHAIRKYVKLSFDAVEAQSEWFGWRPGLKAEMVKLPSQAELRTFVSDDLLDPSNPRTVHYLDQARVAGPSRPTVQRNLPLAAGAPNRESKMSGPEDKQSIESAPVSITGMHRSGTSMVARLLNLCGLYLGRDSELLNPAPDNPEGFWENARFVGINEALLAGFDGAWDVPPAFPPNWLQDARLLPLRAQAAGLIDGFANQPHWGWKDPRTSLTVPFWQELLPDLRVIICLRHPLQVADSLFRRGSNSRTFSFRLWEVYYQRLLTSTTRDRRLITHLDAYFIQPEAELERVLGWLGWPASAEMITDACKTIRTSPQNGRAAQPGPGEGCPPDELLSLYSQLCAEAGPIFGHTQERATSSAGAPNASGGKAVPPAGNSSRPEVARRERELYMLEQEEYRLKGLLEEQGRWARELEAIAREQQATIRAYQRALGPLLICARAARTIKARFTGRS